MVEHAETFLSLYAVDMDAALEVQPPDSWDSFPLFQLLNDFMRIDCKHYTIILSVLDWCVSLLLRHYSSSYYYITLYVTLSVKFGLKSHNLIKVVIAKK